MGLYQSNFRFDGALPDLDVEVPPWAHAPVSEMPWRARMAVRSRWWAWLFGTAHRR